MELGSVPFFSGIQIIFTSKNYVKAEISTGIYIHTHTHKQNLVKGDIKSRQTISLQLYLFN